MDKISSLEESVLRSNPPRITFDSILKFCIFFSSCLLIFYYIAEIICLDEISSLDESIV